MSDNFNILVNRLDEIANLQRLENIRSERIREDNEIIILQQQLLGLSDIISYKGYFKKFLKDQIHIFIDRIFK